MNPNEDGQHDFEQGYQCDLCGEVVTPGNGQITVESVICASCLERHHTT